MGADDTTRATQALSVLQALADPVRLAIAQQLAACGDDELVCGALDISITKSTATHHIRTLVRAGVIGERVEGRCKYLWLRRSELDKRFPGLIHAVLEATR